MICAIFPILREVLLALYQKHIKSTQIYENQKFNMQQLRCEVASSDVGS